MVINRVRQRREGERTERWQGPTPAERSRAVHHHGLARPRDPIPAWLRPAESSGPAQVNAGAESPPCVELRTEVSGLTEIGRECGPLQSEQPFIAQARSSASASSFEENGATPRRSWSEFKCVSRSNYTVGCAGTWASPGSPNASAPSPNDPQVDGSNETRSAQRVLCARVTRWWRWCPCKFRDEPAPPEARFHKHGKGTAMLYYRHSVNTGCAALALGQ